MDWDQLRIFLAATRAGSLRGASEQLGVNHATVNRAIRALEATLNTRLFDRSAEGLSLKVGDKAAGVIRAQARRMDVIPAGGRYIEPVQGRPRRVQGRIVGGNHGLNEIYLNAGPGLVVTPMAPQRAGDFSIGQLVTFDVQPGATLDPSDPA